jgi:hypothetical protein
MTTQKTAKGTSLPILSLRGKDYLEVKYRVVWFREDHPNWSIETEILRVEKDWAMAKATIRDEAGRVISTSHKVEDVKGFGDFIEKSETGAIGRALALVGYGTQFCADELDEGERIVDSPSKRTFPSKQTGPVTEKQLGRMFALSRDAQWTNEELKAVLLGAFGVESSKALSLQQYEAICSALLEKRDPTSAVEVMKKAVRQ